MFNLNPKKMQQMMKQMGMDAEEVTAQKVTIDLGETELVFSDPELTKIEVKGTEMFQLRGSYEERAKGPSAEDVELVAEKAGVSEDEAREALKKTGGDIAEAVMQLEA